MSPFEHGEVFVLDDGGEVCASPPPSNLPARKMQKQWCGVPVRVRAYQPHQTSSLRACVGVSRRRQKASVHSGGPCTAGEVSDDARWGVTTQADLDLGNYERFLDVRLTKDNNITTGKIYQHVIERERRGDYLGKTVQVRSSVCSPVHAARTHG